MTSKKTTRKLYSMPQTVSDMIDALAADLQISRSEVVRTAIIMLSRDKKEAGK